MENSKDVLLIQNYLLALKEADKEELLSLAEEAMQGMLVLSGTGGRPAFVGIPPRWEENNFGVAGYTWTLSRMVYMVTLCKAFLVTGERRYLDKVEVDLANWFETIPTPPVPYDYESACYYHGVHNWRMLELGFRLVYTFPVLLSVLRVYGKDAALLARLEESVAEHAERIAAGSHLLWPDQDHNHYTQEVNGLLSAAALLPDHPRASFWRNWAMEGLETACAKQMTEDGAQIEGASEYHADVVIDFAHSLQFAKKCGRSFSPDFVKRVQKGMEFAVHTMSPDGNMLPYGDSDVLVTTPISIACMGYMLFGDVRYLATIRQFMTDDKILKAFAISCPWGFDRIPELIVWLKQPLKSEDTILLSTSTYQRQNDQYFVRTGWDKEAVCLYFSCHSPIHHGAHCHMDQLGIIFGAYGKILLQDPGRYTYKSCEDRHLFKSSQVHNVPTVNGRDAFEYRDTFIYGPQKEGRITAILDTDMMKGVSGTHYNYDPVTISRSVALVEGRILVIADTFDHIKGEDMKVFFHMNSVNVSTEGVDFVTKDSDVNLRIIPVAADTGFRTEILEGRLSDVFYHDYPSKRSVYTKKATKEQETLIFLVIPYASEECEKPENILWEGNHLAFDYQGKTYHLGYEEGTLKV